MAEREYWKIGHLLHLSHSFRFCQLIVTVSHHYTTIVHEQSSTKHENIKYSTLWSSLKRIFRICPNNMIYDLSWVQRVNNSYICISIWALQRVVFKFWIFSAARSELGVVVVRLGLCDWQPIKAAAVETWSWVTPLKYLNICWCRHQQGHQGVLKNKEDLF